MTAIVHVSKQEMKERTGFSNALGYSLPKEDKILVRKNLPKEKKKEVLAHEEEHILNGEEGPFLGAIIGAAGAIGGALLSKRSSDKATDAQVDASNAEIAYAKETRDLIRGDQAPYISAGHTALDALMSMTGLASPRSSAKAPANPNFRQPPEDRGIRNYLRGLNIMGRDGPRLQPRYAGGAISGSINDGNIRVQPQYSINEMGPENVYRGGAVTRNSNPATIDGSTGYVEPNENPGGVEGGYNFQTDPGYKFRFSEGMRALDRGSAAAGGLLSGGYARRATRYGQDYASNEYTNVYNRIANIAGIGQVANQQNAGAALATSGQVGGALSNAGAARASGYTAGGNAWGTAINEVAKLPWGDIFRGGSPTVWKGPPT